MPRKWKPEEYKYQQEYIHDNIKFVNIPFNMKNGEDVELFEYLNSIEGKKATYMKQLIRRDMVIEPIRYPPTRYSEELCGCPLCKHEVKPEADSCEYCGVKLDWSK